MSDFAEIVRLLWRRRAAAHPPDPGDLSMSLQVVSPAPRPSTPRGRVDILEEVPAGTAEEFRALYRAAFEPLMAKSPARQWLTDEEFLHEMEDPKVLKFVARHGDSD